MALYHMLDFGSGYEPLLQRRLKRGVRETLQYGIIGLHISATRLDHHRMKAFSPFDVQSFFGIEGREEEEVMPGITMAKPVSLCYCHCVRTPAHDLCGMHTRVPATCLLHACTPPPPACLPAQVCNAQRCLPAELIPTRAVRTTRGPRGHAARSQMHTAAASLPAREAR